MSCRGTMKQDAGLFIEIQEHNHAPDDNMEAKAIFIRELKIAIQGRSGSKRDIYDCLSIL